MLFKHNSGKAGLCKSGPYRFGINPDQDQALFVQTPAFATPEECYQEIAHTSDKSRALKIDACCSTLTSDANKSAIAGCCVVGTIGALLGFMYAVTYIERDEMLENIILGCFALAAASLAISALILLTVPFYKCYTQRHAFTELAERKEKAEFRLGYFSFYGDASAAKEETIIPNIDGNHAIIDITGMPGMGAV